MAIFLRELDRTPLLSADEEIRLGRLIATGRTSEPGSPLWKAGQVARNELAAANIRLAVSMAKDYLGRSVDLPDLIEEASIGIVEAARRFDPDRGVRFASYAAYWVRMKIRRAIIDTGNVIRIPGNVRDVWTEMNRGADVSESRARLADYGRHASLVYSLDGDRWTSSDGSESADPDQGSCEAMVDHSAEDVAEVIGGRELEERVRVLVSEMVKSPRSGVARMGRVLVLRYGLGDGDQMTAADVGRAIGLTPQWVREIERRGLAVLRESLGGQD
jgi:RNA polymerase primary sigma factor